MVPGLEARLMESSEDEVIHMVDLVRHECMRVDTTLTLTSTDPERRQWCKGRRYEGHENCDHQLDHA